MTGLAAVVDWIVRVGLPDESDVAHHGDIANRHDDRYDGGGDEGNDRPTRPMVSGSRRGSRLNE